MDAELIITKLNKSEKKVAFLKENGRLVRTIYNEDSAIGNIYIAKVRNIVKNLNAAFIDIGADDTLYYSLEDNDSYHIFTRHGKSEKICQGDELLIQVTRDPYKNKKGVASGNLTLKGNFVIINCTGEVGVSKRIEDTDKRNELKKLISIQLTIYIEQLIILAQLSVQKQKILMKIQ